MGDLVVKCSYCKTSDHELVINITTYSYHYGICVECFRKVFDRIFGEIEKEKVGKKRK